MPRHPERERALIISFVCPSAPTPTGGVTALYEFANGLARRGHVVHLAHGSFWGRPGVRDVAEMPWVRFEPSIQHHFGDGAIPLPNADILFGTGAPPELGLPVLLLQGIDMFPEAFEREQFLTPCLKVCVASWLVGVGERFGVPPEQLVVVPYGIDHDTFRLRAPVAGREPLVGMLFNTHPAKGWGPGREALELVLDRLPDVRVVLFGVEAPEDALPPRTTFLRAPGPAELVEQVYGRCQVFVQPSMYEGFGFTAVEAMACGAALVSTDNGGSRDYAVHDETALVVERGDAVALADAVEALLRDDSRRHRLAEAGSAYVRRFDWDASAAELERHLEAYLADPDRFRQPAQPPTARPTS